MEDRPLPKSVREIDREIVRCGRELARRNLRIGRLARRLLESRSWRTLGYRSSAQYARERVGVSLSSLEHRATLARRIDRWPVLGEALEQGEIGYEAALLIGRVLGRSSSAELVRAWIERAKVRTYKHLREEVDAVLFGTGLDPRVDRGPPTDEDLEAAAQFERRAQSGDLFRSLLGARTPGPQTYVTLIAGGSPIRPLRLTLPVELQLHWQHIEAEFHATAGWRASFVAFVCFSLWSTWLPYLDAWDDKWIDIYRRDRHRCSSPVCERCDVTPHHIVYGGAERTNVLAACSWCHLYGIHRGRLSVRGPASRAEWTVGSQAWDLDKPGAHNEAVRRSVSHRHTLERSTHGAHRLLYLAPRPSGAGLRSFGLCPEPRAAGMTATLCDPTQRRRSATSRSNQCPSRRPSPAPPPSRASRPPPHPASPP